MMRTPGKQIQPLSPDERERYFSRVKKTDGGCWEWLGSRRGRGYGMFYRNGELIAAHRIAIQEAGQTLDCSLLVDHICRNRACVNPAHLRQVDNATNVRENSVKRNTLKTHCSRGHEFVGGNLILRYGKRKCRECHLQGLREYRLRKKEAKCSHESAVATATRPSEAYLSGISPQSAWPFEQDDKGTE